MSFSLQRRGAKAIVLAVVAAALYLGTLSHELVWDDLRIEANVREIEARHGAWGVFTSDFRLDRSSPTGYYRPLVSLSFLLDSRLQRVLRCSYHLTNVLAHSLNTVLVFALLSLLLAPTGAFSGALLFAVHPALTESVAFAAGRSDLLAATGILASATLFLREQRQGSARPWALRAAAAVLFLLASLFKEVAFVLPAVLCGWFALLSPGDRPAKGDLTRRLLPWVLLWLGGAAVHFAARWGLADVPLLTTLNPSAGAGGLSVQLPIWTTYFRLLLLPWPLAPWYDVSEVGVSPLNVAATLVLFAAVAWAGRGSRSRTGVLSIVWIVGFLLPAALSAGTRGGAVVAERFLYIPMVGFCLLAGGLVESATRVSKRLAFGALALVLLAGAGATVARSRVWRDEITLFSAALQRAPRVALVHGFLGNAYFNAGRYAEAAAAFARSTELDPGNANLWYALGNSYFKLLRPKEAVPLYLRAIEARKGSFPEAYYNLGMAYRALGLEREAQAAFARASGAR